MRTTINVWRPGKRPTAMVAPSGKPTAQAIATAVRLTRRLNNTIATSVLSPPVIRSNAWDAAAPRPFIVGPAQHNMYYDAYRAIMGNERSTTIADRAMRQNMHRLT